MADANQAIEKRIRRKAAKLRLTAICTTTRHLGRAWWFTTQNDKLKSSKSGLTDSEAIQWLNK